MARLAKKTRIRRAKNERRRLSRANRRAQARAERQAVHQIQHQINDPAVTDPTQTQAIEMVTPGSVAHALDTLLENDGEETVLDNLNTSNLPPLEPVSESHFHLYISARKRWVETRGEERILKLGVALRLITGDGRSWSHRMKFFHFVDRCQGTQFAINQALEFITQNLGVTPSKVTIITDELLAAGFIENQRTNLSQLEGSLLTSLQSLGCALEFRRPAKDDETFKLVRRQAIENCSRIMPHQYRCYNKRFVRSLTKWWTANRFGGIYRILANETLRGFFPEAAFLPKYINTNYVLTQLFSGHGAFLSYLHRFKVKGWSECGCDRTSPQTVEHVLMYCPIYGSPMRRAFDDAGLPHRCLMELTCDLSSYKVFLTAAPEVHRILQEDNQ